MTELAIARFSTSDPDFDGRLDALLAWDVSEDSGILEIVRGVISHVRADGDAAVAEENGEESSGPGLGALVRPVLTLVRNTDAIEARYSINWPKDEEAFFDGADSVVIFCSGGGGHLVNGHVEEFDKLMRGGAGLACLHYAVEVPIGPSAKGMLNWMGGYFETNWSVNPHWKANF